MKKMIATGIAGLLLLAGCSASPTSEVKGDNTGGETETTQTSTEAPTTEADADGIYATYKVTTTGKASVSWANSSGMSQKEVKAGSWSKKIKLDDFDIATLTVTNGDFMKKVKVTCEILINGVSKSKNSASGTAAIASCSTNTTE